MNMGSRVRLICALFSDICAQAKGGMIWSIIDKRRRSRVRIQAFSSLDLLYYIYQQSSMFPPQSAVGSSRICKHHSSIIWLTFSFVVLSCSNSVEAISGLNSIDDLKDFFKTTFIRKETGEYKRMGKKTEYAEGFNPSWGMYRFHHACLRGGSDGIFTGIDGVSVVTSPEENIISGNEWNDLIGSQFNHPLTTYILGKFTGIFCWIWYNPNLHEHVMITCLYPHHITTLTYY